MSSDSRLPVSLLEKYQLWIAALLILIHISIITWESHKHAPTIDEKAYLAAGLSILEFGRLDLACVSPPLVRLLAATAIQFIEYKTDWSRLKEAQTVRQEHSVGRAFVHANGSNVFHVFTIARLACIPFSILGALICFFWARELYGYRAGLLALYLWCFCPNMIAHGQLITADVAAASLALLTCYTFRKWLHHTSLQNALFFGVALGLAQLTKYTLLILYPILILITGYYIFRNKRDQPPKAIIALFGIFLVSALIINIGYGFSGSFTPIGKYEFKSELLGGVSKNNRFRDTVISSLPIPLPKYYLLGIDLQKRDFESVRSRGYTSYLRGEVRDSGWWYYYLYAACVKIPIGTWILLLLSFAFGLVKRREFSTAESLLLLTPAISIFLLVSSQHSFNEHFRYVLPSFGFFFIWISRVAIICESKKLFAHALVLLPCLWIFISVFTNLPNSLSYFNEVVGGGRYGHNHLIDSNLDWGQDLLLLQNWLEEHPEVNDISYSYFGDVSPKHIGIASSRQEYMLPSFTYSNISPNLQDIAPGYFALSITTLRIAHYFYINQNSTHPALRDSSVMTYNHLQTLGYIFENFKPINTIGWSIYVYNLTEDDVYKMRRSLAIQESNK